MPNNGNTNHGARDNQGVLLPVYISLLIFATTLVPSTWSGFACMENPCMHGICIDSLQINSTHQCYCRNGFTGYSCQINWDECRSQPCLNGGSCVDGIASFNCSCLENFAGVYCEIDLSICEDAFPCQNNGTCTLDVKNVTGTGIICSCPPGFTGHQCEVDISVCNETENVCQNGGKCVDGLGTRFYCECEPGWSGETCHIEIDECESQPCLNGGICVNKINDFSCACPFGFTGRACETKLRICEENPCLNGAFCLNEQDDESKKTCYCVPDYHGTLCEFRYDDCDPPPKCFNGGTCIDGVGEFTCSCPLDFFGPSCQCTADNATEPECSYYANGTMPTWPESVYSSIGGLFPTQTLQIPAVTTMKEVPLPSEMYSSEVATFVKGVPTASPVIPSPSPYDPGGGEGRDGIETTALLLPPESSLRIPEDSSIAPTHTFIEPSVVVPFTPVSELASVSLSAPIYPELSPAITIEGAEETISLPPASPAPSLQATPVPTDLMPPEETIMTPQPPLLTTAVEPSPEFDSTAGVVSPSETTKYELEVTPTVVPDSISTVPVPSPPGIHTVDLTAGLPPTESVTPEADIVEPTELFSPPVSVPQATITVPPSSIGEIPASDSFSMEGRPDITITPTLPVITGWESVQPSSFIPGVLQSLPESVDQSITIERTTAVPDADLAVSLFPTPIISGELPQQTATVLVTATLPPSEGDYETLTTGLVGATPTVELLPPSSSLPFPLPLTSQPNLTDPCNNYCHNNAKCIADTIEPICLCSFKFIGNRCEIPREKFKAASFTGDSFLSFRVPNESIISKVDIRSKLVTIIPEGILLYTGVGRMYALIFTQNGHVTLHFSCGSQSMHFVETRTRVDNGFNFTLDFRMEMIVQGVSQLRCSAEVSVNQSYVMKGEQVVGRDGVIRSAAAAAHPIELVFLGGIPPFHTDAAQNDDLVSILPGFRGCLHTLMVNQEQKDIYDDALDGKEVAECSSFGCVANPCHGSARCVTTHAYPFWECICPQGYKGHRCQIIVCSSNPCQNGATCTYSQDTLNLLVQSEEEDLPGEGDAPSPTSTMSPSDREKLQPICLCPLGFSGSVCQHKINVTKPAFKPLSGYSAFIAYDPIPRFIDWFQLKFHFVTKNITQISLLLYSGNNRGPQPLVMHNNNHHPHHNNNDDHNHDASLAPTSSSTPSSNNHMMLMSGFDQILADPHPEPVSDFFAITFLKGFIALTWNLGSGTQRITTPSRIDNRLNIHTLFAGRSGRQAWLKVDGMRNVTGKTPGPLYRLNSDSNELYIGGYKSYKFEGLSHDLPLHQGFQGCIFDLGFRVKNRLYLPRAITGRNVKNCFEEDC